ncbi:MAG: MFS transporter, partial [Actinomycetota bacterium]
TLSLVTTSFAEGAPRNRAIGVWSATGAGGLAAGVFVGGMLTTTLGWRWVFFVNVPVLAVLVLAAPSVLPGVRPPRPSVHQFDVPGAVTVTAGAMLVVLSFAEATTLGWTAPGTWAPAVAGIALLGAFLAIESRSTSPLMPLWLARRRTLWGAMLVTAAFMASFGMQFFFLTMYLQSALHQSPLAAGVSVLPLATGVFIGTNAGGRLATRFGFRRVLPVAFVVGAAGLFAYTFVSPARPLTVLLVLEVVTGLGQGVSFSTAYVAAGSGVEPSRAGVASAMASTAQQLGGSVGLALLVDLLSAKLPGSHAGTFRLDRSPIPGLVPALHWVFAAQGAIALTGALVAVVVIGRAAPGEAMAEHAPAATAAPIHDERSSSDALREAG